MNQPRHLDWNAIDAAAKAIGVKAEARKKWRQRGVVPPRWHFQLVKQTGGEISMVDFESTPPSKEAAR